MGDYWSEVYAELVEPEAGASLEALAGSVSEPVERMTSSRRYHYRLPQKRGPKGVAVYLGEHFPGVYFTARESHCALLILRGMTVRAIAATLALSPRTVEYYVENMKSKLKVRRKPELIQVLLGSDFLSNLRYIARHDEKRHTAQSM
jgi:DNA-binding CsgD family transcriptional regulator